MDDPLTKLVQFDPGPMVRFDEFKADPNAPSEVFQRVCEGESLGEVAREKGFPRGRFVEWYTTKYTELYDLALKVRADGLVAEALRISDERETDQVPRDKLRVDTRMKVAGKWDRARYGESVRVERGIAPPEDAALAGFAAELIARIGQRLGAKQREEIEVNPRATDKRI